jgi:DNA ligase-1
VGLEGIMIKNKESPYECKRSSAWMKWKPVITVDLEVVDIQEGTGKYEGSFGSFICEGVEDGKLIKVHVGSGITDDQRTEYWKNRKKLKGMVVEIMADAVTKNQSDDDTYSLRFPRFVRFRGFEAGEKI